MQGKPLILDVTTKDADANKKNVIKYHPYQYLGSAAKMGVEDERRLYGSLTDPSTQSFMPMTFELLWNWWKSAV